MLMKHPTTSTVQNKSRIIAEGGIVYILYAGILWSAKLTSGLSAWQEDLFGHKVITTILAMVLLPAIIMWFTSKPGNIALITKDTLKKAWHSCGKSLSVMMPITALSFPVIQALGYSFKDWIGASVIGFWHLVAFLLLCRVFKKQQQDDDVFPARRDLIRIISLFSFSVIITGVLHSIHTKAAQIFIALIFVGQAEEFIFRGYFQTRLNQAFGKSYSLFGYSFGWGLISASLLFGLMHSLSPGDPWHWAWGIWTAIAGLCFGIIRDKGGSFVASGLVHGIIWSMAS